ncbi:putative bifunctional diguanylate cyclase/phosphodiesterase [Rhodococcus aerolatus]
MTVLGTVAVVVLELALLVAVYHRPDEVTAEQLLAARAVGAVAAAPGSAERVRTGLADELAARGADPALVAGLRSPAADPGQAVAAAADELEQAHRRVDAQSSTAFVVLLLVASVGWMVWFRRVVARHRGMARAVTEQRATAAAERRLAGLVRNSSDLVVVCSPGSSISWATPSAAAVLGRDPATLVGTRFTDLVHPDDRADAAHLLATDGGEHVDLRLRLLRHDGRAIHVEGTVAGLLDGDDDELVVTVRDISERAVLEQRLTHDASHDHLTGLANRRRLLERLDHVLTRAGPGAPGAVLLFCDLDGFTEVNDRWGHRVGDLVLVEVGRRLSTTVRAADTVARLGGDEFAVLVEHAGPTGAQGTAERVLAELGRDVVVDGVALRVAASIGTAPGTPGVHTPEDLLRNADAAMYLAKQRGGAQVAAYEPELHDAARRRAALRDDLEVALTDGGLRLQYQPTVDLRDGRVVGFEALVRWQHPALGLLAPAAFVPLAEETGLVVRLGRWVLAEACRAAVQVGAPEVAVNVAPQQLACDGFPAEVGAVLAVTGLAPERLVLEITERVALDDVELAATRLQALRALGVRIAIDDFGTGYSSLSYLDRLPLDVLKLDKSFVDGVTAGGRTATVASTILAMGRSMGLRTVAEGVEGVEQSRWLAANGCDRGQGYLWSRPLDLADAAALLDPSTAVDDAVRVPG